LGTATKLLLLAVRNPLTGLFELLRHRIRVPVEREGRGVMTRECLSDLRIGAAPDERRDEEVPQHVERAGHPCFLQQRGPGVLVPVAGVDGRADRSGEYELAGGA